MCKNTLYLGGGGDPKMLHGNSNSDELGFGSECFACSTEALNIQLARPVPSASQAPSRWRWRWPSLPVVAFSLQHVQQTLSSSDATHFALISNFAY